MDYRRGKERRASTPGAVRRVCRREGRATILLQDLQQGEGVRQFVHQSRIHMPSAARVCLRRRMIVPAVSRMRVRCLLPLAASAVIGCSGLKVRPADPAVLKVAKVAVRVPLAIITAGQSEMIYGTDRMMESWLGHSADELLVGWGPPTQILSDGVGGYVLLYTQQRSRFHAGEVHSTTNSSVTGYVYPNFVTVQGSEQTHTTYTPSYVERWSVYRTFRVDSTGVVAAYSWRGL